MSVLAPAKLHRVGRGPAVVLMHCLGVDRHVWRGTIDALCDRFEVITYDFPGHGEAPVPAASYDIAELSHQLADALRSAGIARAHIAGVSLGGLVGQHFAAHFPEMIDRLALIDTVSSYVPEWRQRLLDRGNEARAKGTAALTEGVLAAWFTAPFIAEAGTAVSYIRRAFAATPGEGYAKACEALVKAELEPLAPRIKAPTLVLCGDQDAPIFLSAAQWLQAHLSTAALTWLKPGKHAALLEQPDQFASALKSHLG